MRYLVETCEEGMGDAADCCAARGDLGTFPPSCVTTSSKPVAPAVASLPGPWASVSIGASNGFSFTPIELSAPGESWAPFCCGAGSANTVAPASELPLAAEPAAKVGAVDGALKPPSEDAIAGVRKGVLGTHQITSRATADNLKIGVTLWALGKPNRYGARIDRYANIGRRCPTDTSQAARCFQLGPQ